MMENMIDILTLRILKSFYVLITPIMFYELGSMIVGLSGDVVY